MNKSDTVTAYYVSPDGNDNNSGTSSYSPWKTLAKVNSTTLQDDYSVLFERGEQWYEQLYICLGQNKKIKL